ncbi:glutamate racemase [Flexithrix dorotheae]|uniref:glutamate racemase n=1 Tax=Flexithrix dorotheae TaxID=70993 RepID=UPI0003777840|nr:glutamate racemase [Flexithrix dorotheae]
MDNRPIGIFDSGVGGLSVWKEMVATLPRESIFYYGDTKNCPYGPKTTIEVQNLCTYITNFLLEQDCKMIVVACNTATSIAISSLRNSFNIPFIGIEPAIKPAALHTKTGKIGVLATLGTIKGDLFNATKSKYAENIEVIEQIGHGLVELIEAGKGETDEMEQLLKKYLSPMMAKGVDKIVLGCTHYPFISEMVLRLIENKADLINPAPAVTQQIIRVLEKNKLQASTSNEPDYKFFISGNKQNFEQFFCRAFSNFDKRTKFLEI